MNGKNITVFLLFVITLTSASAQHFRNLDFEQLCDSSKTGLCYWDLSWGNKKNVRQDRVGNNTCLLIQGNTKTEVGFAEQAADITPLKEISVITLSAEILSEPIEGKGAGLNINLHDAEGQLLAFKDMGGFYSVEWITGTKGWNGYTISLVCPVGTARIKIGAILFGKGKVWFNNYKVTLTPVANKKPSKLAVKYISAACDSIKKHSLFRDSFDLAKIKPMALKIAGNAKRYHDCYLAIQYLLESLREYGDYHSFFMKAVEVKNWEDAGSVVTKPEFPSWKIIDGNGYINVPSFHGGNPKIMLAYADTLQAAIRKLDGSGIKGWIIDLRENTGGNMAPMIAGLGPLFSSDKLGSLVDVNGRSDGWYYRDGRYYDDEFAGWSVSDPVKLSSSLPIAVMTSNKVGSSGEIVVISFIGNARTRSFGQATMGLTTGNGSFELADGSQIFLASTIMADRNGKQYTGSIQPDTLIDKMFVDKKDMVLAAAIDWIRSAQ
jgi:hypothetical protein